MKLISVKFDGTANTAVDRDDHPPARRFVQMVIQVARADGYDDQEVLAALVKEYVDQSQMEPDWDREHDR